MKSLYNRIMVGTTHSALLLPFLLPLLILLLLFLLFRLHPRHQACLPSPRRLPVIGHLHLLTSLPHQSFYRLSQRLGPVFSLSLASTPCIVACSASAAQEFLKTHEPFFSNRPLTKAVSILTYGSSNFSFSPYGSFWRFAKRLSVLELFSSQTLEQFRPIRRDEIRQLLEEFQAKSMKGEVVDLSAEMTRMTNNVTSRMAVSRRCSGTDAEAEEAIRLVVETTELLGKFNLADYLWFCKNLDLQGFDKRLQNLHQRFDGLMEKIIEEREEKRRKRRQALKKEEEIAFKAKDLLDILMDTLEDEGAEVKLTRDNVKAFIRDIFTGGTDNTSLTVQWAMAELINNPIYMQKARAELDAIIKNHRLVEENDIPSLPYLKAIVMETLRLHPPTPLIPRESDKDCMVNGFKILAKTRLFIDVWAIGREAKHWPNPHQFMPERFLHEENNGGACIDVRGQHFHLIPFGSGRRGCPGITAALQIVYYALASLIQCFEWKLVGGTEKVDMTEAPGLTLRRATPLLCIPIARHDSLLSLF